MADTTGLKKLTTQPSKDSGTINKVTQGTATALAANMTIDTFSKKKSVSGTKPTDVAACKRIHSTADEDVPTRARNTYAMDATAAKLNQNPGSTNATGSISVMTTKANLAIKQKNI